MKEFAFTLAEVLVTLGIIGVVSAMTVPTLMQNHQRKTYVTQLHKVYNEFQQSFVQKINDHNAVNLTEAGFVSGSEEDFLNSYFKIVKYCDKTTADCFASSYNSLSGSSVDMSLMTNGYKAVLASGASVSLDLTDSAGTGDCVGSIFVDINGKSGPNIAGRDLFRMYIYSDGVLDDYLVDSTCRKTNVCSSGNSAKDLRETNFNDFCNKSGDPDGCFGKILNDNWEMTY